jgi:hypothetical protein
MRCRIVLAGADGATRRWPSGWGLAADGAQVAVAALVVAGRRARELPERPGTWSSNSAPRVGEVLRVSRPRRRTGAGARGAQRASRPPSTISNQHAAVDVGGVGRDQDRDRAGDVRAGDVVVVGPAARGDAGAVLGVRPGSSRSGAVCWLATSPEQPALTRIVACQRKRSRHGRSQLVRLPADPALASGGGELVLLVGHRL